MKAHSTRTLDLRNIVTLIVCTFLIPMVAHTECNDTDNGYNMAVAGLVDIADSSGNISTYPDYCARNGRSVIKYSCSGKGALAASAFSCRYGCYGGRCSGRRIEGEKACYVKLILSEELSKSGDVTVKVGSVRTVVGDYSFAGREYFGTPVDYLLELRDASGALLGTYGVLSGMRPPFVEEFTETGPISHTKVIPDPGIYDTEVIVPFDSTVRTYKLINPSDKAVVRAGTLSFTSLTCGGCVPAGQYGEYYKNECCPGTTPFYTKKPEGHLFVCSTCKDQICLPAKGSTAAIPTAPPIQPTASVSPSPATTARPIASVSPSPSTR